MHIYNILIICFAYFVKFSESKTKKQAIQESKMKVAIIK